MRHLFMWTAVFSYCAGILLIFTAASQGADRPAADTPEAAAVRTAATEGLKALEGEDRAAIDKWVTFGNPDGSAIVDSILKQRRAEHEFRVAVAEKFGDAGCVYAAHHARDHSSLDYALGDIKDGSVAINGDTAKITSSSAVFSAGLVPRAVYPTWSLKKVGDAWKLIDEHGYAADTDVKEATKEREDHLARIEKRTSGVRDGRYKTLDDVDREVYDQIHANDKAHGYLVLPRTPINPETGLQKESRIAVPDSVIGVGAGGELPSPFDSKQQPERLPAQGAEKPAQAARKIVFVLDGSEASKANFQSIVTELGIAVDNLKPSQTFAVIVAGGGELKKLDDALLSATEQNRHKVEAFLKDIHAGGKADLVAAMKAAVAYGPELIYLTACDVPKEAKLSAAVAALNKGTKARIHTLGFDLNADAEGEMQTIATGSGGVYHSIKTGDLEGK